MSQSDLAARLEKHAEDMDGAEAICKRVECEEAALYAQFAADLRAAAQAVRAVQWRPISEAPKDGTILLVHRHGCVTPFLAAWLDGAAINQPGWHHVDINKRFHTAPTHYLPLPAPPEATR